MSLKETRVDWLIGRKDLRPSEKVLSLVLNRYADGEGYCWPSLRRMAEDGALSLRQVTRGVKNLEEKGVLHRFKTDRGRVSRNLYRMLFPPELVRPNGPDRQLPPFRDPRVTQGNDQAVNAGVDVESTNRGQEGLGSVDSVSCGDGQDVPCTVDGMATGGWTSCPRELKDLESFDSETGKREGGKGEDPTGERALPSPALSSSCGMAPTTPPTRSDEGRHSGDGETGRDLASRVLELYGDLCPGLPPADRLSFRRILRVRAMTEEFPEALRVQWWRDYFRRVSLSAFLRGRGSKGWRADLDWLLEPENARKVLAGNYDGGLVGPAGSGTRILDYVTDMTIDLGKDLGYDL